MKIAGICDRDTAVALRLAGVKDLFFDNKNYVKLWNDLIQRDDIGIVFITEQIAEELSRELKDFRARFSLPIIVEIPDKKGRMKDHVDYVSLLIKKAVGVEVGKE